MAHLCNHAPIIRQLGLGQGLGTCRDRGSQRGWEKRACDGIIMDIDGLSYIYGI